MLLCYLTILSLSNVVRILGCSLRQGTAATVDLRKPGVGACMAITHIKPQDILSHSFKFSVHTMIHRSSWGRRVVYCSSRGWSTSYFLWYISSLRHRGYYNCFCHYTSVYFFGKPTNINGGWIVYVRAIQWWLLDATSIVHVASQSCFQPWKQVVQHEQALVTIISYLHTCVLYIHVLAAVTICMFKEIQYCRYTEYNVLVKDAVLAILVTHWGTNASERVCKTIWVGHLLSQHFRSTSKLLIASMLTLGYCETHRKNQTMIWARTHHIVLYPDSLLIRRYFQNKTGKTSMIKG